MTSTPRPQARLIAAATCSEGLNPTIGYSMPRSWGTAAFSWSVRRVIGGVAVRPAVVGLARGAAADGVHQPDAARHLVPGDLRADVLLNRGQIGGPAFTQLHQLTATLAAAAASRSAAACWSAPIAAISAVWSSTSYEDASAATALRCDRLPPSRPILVALDSSIGGGCAASG